MTQMEPKKIQNNPSLKKLNTEANKFRNFKKAWKYLQPLAKLLGINTSDIDDKMNKMDEIIEQTEEFVGLPDKFNDVFSDKGWICFDSFNTEVMKKAIKLAETSGIENAENYLVDYFSPKWVKSRLIYFEHLKGFKIRYPLIEKACEDYEAGRYYSSTLVVLTIIDGIVNEFNICDHQRLGFFSKESKVIAWDSLAAHEKGLVKLQEVFGKSRCVTRTEQITIPYRHGIIHGMDLGYDNEIVSAKCWATLFALRDWVIKVTKNELIPPEEKPHEVRSLYESIEDYINLQNQIEKQKQWMPREIIIGVDVPNKGKASEYGINTPERKLIEFLSLWIAKNYGFMAKCYPPDFDMRPVSIKEKFGGFHLLDYELLHICDVTSFISNISVNLKLEKGNKTDDTTWVFRVVRYSKEGKIAYLSNEQTIWYIFIWESKV